ncbi:MAG: polysaccharide biosynthesis tyrosine autokinase [Planctomycetota bacterium]
MELKDYLRVLRRRWYVVLIVWATVAAIHQSLVKQEAVVYESQAEVVIKEPQYYYIGGGDFPLPWLTISPETRFTLMKSEPVLRKTVGYLWAKSDGKHFKDVFEFDAENERSRGVPIGEMKVQGRSVKYRRNQAADAIEKLRVQLTVSKQKETQIVVISARDASGDVARQYADGLAQAFREYMEEDSEEQTTRAKAFLEKQVGEKTKDIDDMEVEVARRRVDMEGKQGNSTQDLQLLQAQARVADLGREIAQLNYEIADLRTKHHDPPTEVLKAIPESFEVVQVHASLGQRNTELIELTLRFTEDHPNIVRKRAQVDELTQRLAGMEAEDLVRRKNLAILGIEAAIREKGTLKTAREAERGELLEEIKKQSDQLQPADLVAARQGLSLLEQRLLVAQNERAGFITRQSSIALSQTTKEPLVDILSEAKEGRAIPKGSQTSWPFMFLIGAFVGVGAAYFLEYMSSSIRTEADIKRYVNLQLLGAVLRIKEPDQRLLLTVAQKQPLHEVYNMIGALMESYAAEHKAKVFMVASSRAEEGKSTVTTNLGIALAKGGERVILVDCDLRKAVLHKFLNVDNSRGLSTALLAEREGAPPTPIEDLLRPTEVEGLRLLPAGAHPQNPVGLLKSEAYRRVLREARDQADVVLVDVPPVNLAVDPLVLAPLMDGIILLVSAGDVTKDEVSHAKRLIEGARGKLIGCILNKVTLEGRGYYYYYQYYYDAYKSYRET